jgi:hypothetical protein
MLRAASALCVVAALGLLAWAAYSARQSPPGPEPGFVVAPTEHDLGSVPLGDRVVTFTITNPAAGPRRILGAAGGCWGAVCFDSKHSTQIVIPAGETFTYECELSVGQARPFEAKIDLYLEDNGLRTVTLTVRGVGVAPGGKADGSQTP